MPSYADVRIETARLVLRPFRHADAADLMAIYSDPEVFRYVPIGDWKHIDEAHQRIARDINAMAAGEMIRLALERREDSRVIGEALVFKFDIASKRADLGYALARAAWGCGYVSEAVPPLVDYAFKELGLNRLDAVIDPRNAASAKVLTRLGFQHEGTLREHYIMRGETGDSGL
jgi:ribosomal-protein-alanine N-acetyltransferase